MTHPVEPAAVEPPDLPARTEVEAPAAQGLPARTLFALVTGQVCLHSSMAGLRLALPLMMLTQGGWAGLPAEAVAGVVLGLFAMAPVLLALPAGRWADRRGYHEPVSAAVALAIVGGLLACAAAALSPVAAPGAVRAAVGGPAGPLTLTWLVALQGLLLVVAATFIGTGCNIGLIAMQRTAGRMAQGEAAGDRSAEAGAELRRVFSWLGIAPALGNVGGPLAAGILIDTLGYTWACAALALLPLGKAWWSRRVPRERPERSAPIQPIAPATDLQDSALTGLAAPASPAFAPDPRRGGSVRELLAMPGIRRLLTINWFFSASWDLHGFVVPLLGHERGLSASAIGSVLGLFAASVVAVRLLIPLVAARVQERQVIVGAMSIVAAVFMAYPLARSGVQMSLCAMVLGLALGSVQPMIMTAMHHLAPPHRQGEVIALRSALINLSSSVLPISFGLVGAALGATLLFRGMAVVLLCGLPLAIRLRLGDTPTP